MASLGVLVYAASPQAERYRASPSAGHLVSPVEPCQAGGLMTLPTSNLSFLATMADCAVASLELLSNGEYIARKEQ